MNPVEINTKALLASKYEVTKLIGVNKISPPCCTETTKWLPRTESDYCNGGAYPEIHIAQYPMGMGMNQLRKKDDCEADYELVGGNVHPTNKVVFSNTTLLLSEQGEIKEHRKPNAETLNETTFTTRRALEKLTSLKINAATPGAQIGKTFNTQYVRFTAVQQGHDFNSGAKQRVIKMVEAQVDPMEPPKFKINKKIPRGPPSPPAPVLHSPSRKVSMKEQKEWKVPPCISNWKNAKGYTIPLDKRLAADGRGLQQLHINEKFAKMAEALYIADRKAREAVEARAQLEKRLAQKEKDKKEDMLRVMAQKARDERAGLRISEDGSYEIKQRDALRSERHKDRSRDKNLSRSGPDKRLRLQRERDRDITELIALGKSTKISSNLSVQFDQRLFNRSKGMDTGFVDDETYGVYEKPWRDATSLISHLHRPNKVFDADNCEMEYNQILEVNKPPSVKDFFGLEHSLAQNARKTPIQFEREDDPFGLDQFLNMAKTATKRSENEDQFLDIKRRKKR